MFVPSILEKKKEIMLLVHIFIKTQPAGSFFAFQNFPIKLPVR